MIPPSILEYSIFFKKVTMRFRAVFAGNGGYILSFHIIIYIYIFYIYYILLVYTVRVYRKSFVWGKNMEFWNIGLFVGKSDQKRRKMAFHVFLKDGVVCKGSTGVKI